MKTFEKLSHLCCILLVVALLFFAWYRSPSTDPVKTAPVLEQPIIATSGDVPSAPLSPIPILSFDPVESNENGVKVTVTPSQKESVWRFDIVLDTHVGDLDTDLQISSTLIGSNGTEIRPDSWGGDPPGGHHRSGTLVFSSLSKLPIKLILKDIGGVPERVFEWK